MRKLFPYSLVVLPLMLTALSAHATDAAVGRWTTIDDSTNKPKSVVEIYQAPDGSLAGKVVKIIDQKDGPNPTCKKGECEGKPILGLVILQGLKQDDATHWSGGSVLDPEKGKTYKSKIEVPDANTLKMSGCIAFLCRSQTWLRAQQ